MKILITGNTGYIGPSVLQRLRQSHPQATLIGLDKGYFAHCLTNADILPECRADVQYFAAPASVSTSFEIPSVSAGIENVNGCPGGDIHEYDRTMKIRARKVSTLPVRV